MCPPPRDPHTELDDADRPPEPSQEVVTPRGGFMARPGLKRPPQHAVVVRVGDAPPSEHIPIARSSVPPPPPISEPVLATKLEAPASPPSVETAAPISDSEKVTQRAPVPAGPPATGFPTPPPAPIESVPPPSDVPVVASVALAPRSAQRSRWAIALAAGAGLVLGTASVLTTGRDRETPAAAAGPAPRASALAPPSTAAPVKPRSVTSSVSSARSAPASIAPTPAVPATPAAERPGGSAPRRSIF